jgi:hypothetical protein
MQVGAGSRQDIIAEALNGDCRNQFIAAAAGKSVYGRT